MSTASFRDTSGQDRLLAPRPAWWRGRAALASAAVVSLVAMVAAMARPWSAEHSVSGTRVSIASVELGRFVRDVAAEGRIVAAVSPTLYSAAAGTVTFAVKAGTAVQQGKVLGSVNSPELQAQLAQEQSALQELRLASERAVLESRQQRLQLDELVDKAQIERDVAAAEYQRVQKAFVRGAFSEIEMLRIKAMLEKAEVANRNAQSSRELQRAGIEFNVKAARLARDRKQLLVDDLQRQVELLTLHSPVAGQVGQLLVAERTYVAKDAPLLSVVDLTALEVEINVPEGFARDLAVTMAAQVNSSGREFQGQVSAVAPEVVNGEVTARVRFVGELPPGLRQNQRVAVRVLLDARDGVVMVARGPFVESGAGRAAYVVRGGLAERRAIRLGTSSIDKVEILSGVQPGERIVVAGAENFGEAQRVLISH
jgi:HlyD family secretion protein